MSFLKTLFGRRKKTAEVGTATRVDVILCRYPSDNKLRIIKEIR